LKPHKSKDLVILSERSELKDPESSCATGLNNFSATNEQDKHGTDEGDKDRIRAMICSYPFFVRLIRAVVVLS
jgi:hypothetical protein